MKATTVIALLALLAGTALIPATAPRADESAPSLHIDDAAFDQQQLAAHQGAAGLSGFGALLAALPPGNTVSANLGGTTITQTGTGTQTLSLSQGGSTVNLSASTSGPTSFSRSFTISH